MQKKSQILAVILAGGKGSRFAGQDKGLIEWQGAPMVSHVIRAIEPQVGQVLLSINRNVAEYQSFGHKVLQDDTQGFAGPLSGICTAIKEARQMAGIDAMLVSTCDSPSLPCDYVQALHNQLSSASVAVVHDGHQRQNLHCLIKRSAWPSLLSFFDKGGRAMHRWYAQTDIMEVDFSPQAKQFSNINSPLEATNNHRETG